MRGGRPYRARASKLVSEAEATGDPEASVNGALAAMRAAARAGVEVCFANPGTTELPLVEALDGVPEIRAVLGLFEGVCTGAADGYGRMTGKPALTLLHLGPGFANGVANLHNARRARSPIVNLVGDQASSTRPSPLTSTPSRARSATGCIPAAHRLNSNPISAPRLQRRSGLQPVCRL